MKNGSNLNEVNRLAMKVPKNQTMMIELRTNVSKNRTKRNNLFKLNNTFSKRKAEAKEKDKRERISKFYKAYREKKKQLLKKLEEENRPPLFSGSDMNR